MTYRPKQPACPPRASPCDVLCDSYGTVVRAPQPAGQRARHSPPRVAESHVKGLRTIPGRCVTAVPGRDRSGFLWFVAGDELARRGLCGGDDVSGTAALYVVLRGQVEFEGARVRGRAAHGSAATSRQGRSHPHRTGTSQLRLPTTWTGGGPRRVSLRRASPYGWSGRAPGSPSCARNERHRRPDA